MKIKCAIIDDEPLALDLLESYVKRTPFLSFSGRYSSAVHALQGLTVNPVDLIFVDIQMPELDGIEFSKMLVGHTRVIFTTAFSQYALEGYRVNALDYLLKPVSYLMFCEAANKALEWFKAVEAAQDPVNVREEDHDCIFVKSEYKLLRLYFNDILYVEGLKDYVKIHLESQKKPILSLMNMKTLEEHLPATLFRRIHRSFIVNMSKVNVLERGQIIFGDKRISISDTYKKDIQDYLEKLMLPQRGETPTPS